LLQHGVQYAGQHTSHAMAYKRINGSVTVMGL
jgi:hypothetical protein